MPVSRRTIVAVATGVAVATAATVTIIAIRGRQTPAQMLADGQAYLTGDGVDRNVTKALALLERAALSEDRVNAREAALELVEEAIALFVNHRGEGAGIRADFKRYRR